MKLSNSTKERIKECRRYIEDNKIFYPYKYLIIEFIIGITLLWLGNFQIKFIGGFLFLLAIEEISRREGYLKGFMQGFDEGLMSIDENKEEN